MQKVVSVRIGDVSLIGFVTKEEITDSAKASSLNNLVAVYLPMSYQIGGYTIYIPRHIVKPLDMTVEDAMKTVLTAGLAKQNGR